MTRDLFVASYTPALSSGGGVRTYGVVRALATLGPVDYLHVVFGGDEPAPAYKAIPGVTFHPVHPSRGARRALAYGRSRGEGTPPDFARGVSPELRREAARLADTPGRGRVIADGPVTAASLLGLARRRPVVYNAHNVESLFRHELEGGGTGSQRQLASFERRVMETAGESWLVSRRDMEAARELAPDARVRYVPNVVDVAAITPITAVAPDQRAIFVGDFTYQPNRDGLEFLAADVLPRVWERLPDARLSVVGKGLEGEDLGDSRIEPLGFVDDLAAEYARARCVVVPLLVGGGSPLKFVEALAYGMPIVATPAASAGLDVRPREHFMQADGAEAFADALTALLEHAELELGARARDLARREYSIESLAARLTA